MSFRDADCSCFANPRLLAVSGKARDKGWGDLLGGAGAEDEGVDLGEGGAAVGDGRGGVLCVAGNGEELGDAVEDEGAFAGGRHFAGKKRPGGGGQQEQFARRADIEESPAGFFALGEALVAQDDHPGAAGVRAAGDFAFSVGEAGAHQDGSLFGKAQGFRAFGFEFGGAGFDERGISGGAEDAPCATGKAFAAVAEEASGTLDGVEDGPIEKREVAQCLEVEGSRCAGNGERDGDVFDTPEALRVGTFEGEAHGVFADVADHALQLAFAEENGVHEAGGPGRFAAAGFEAADDVAEGLRRFRRSAGGQGGADEENAVEVVGHDDGGDEFDLGPELGDAEPAGLHLFTEGCEEACPVRFVSVGGGVDGPGSQCGASAFGQLDGHHVDGATAVVPAVPAAAHAVLDGILFHARRFYGGGTWAARKKLDGRSARPVFRLRCLEANYRLYTFRAL